MDEPRERTLCDDGRPDNVCGLLIDSLEHSTRRASGLSANNQTEADLQSYKTMAWKLQFQDNSLHREPIEEYVMRREGVFIHPLEEVSSFLLLLLSVIPCSGSPGYGFPLLLLFLLTPCKLYQRFTTSFFVKDNKGT
ncbi:hypothetical protein J6590_016432 [Homalodisca vitripennis]|nr:hypothetical protein J6590_016432 [Homalodisca vitripennis]